MRALNQWVIRVDSLKKYQVQSQIGVGMQAKVYRIIKRSATSNHQKEEKGGQPDKVFAIKVINKEKLEMKTIYE